MNIFDTHGDTPFEMYRKHLGLDNDRTAVSLGKTSGYDKRVFVCAFWSDNKKDGEDCFKEFLESSAYFDKCDAFENGDAVICKSGSDIAGCCERGSFGAVKAVEGARLLCGDISRLGVLYRQGVRLVLPLWGGCDDIGGAWDTQDGLTAFGKEVVRECQRLGMIVDTSHMSTKSFWDTVSASTKPIIASHSNFKSVSLHQRNLDNEQMRYLIETGGLIGLNLCNAHISAAYSERLATPQDDFIDDALKHIRFLLENGGENVACLGCDWDGTALPPQIPDVSFAYRLYDALISDGVGKRTADRIFFENAYNFFMKNLK